MFQAYVWLKNFETKYVMKIGLDSNIKKLATLLKNEGAKTNPC